MPLIDYNKRESIFTHFPGKAWLLPVIGGLAYACAFPPISCWPLIFLAWIPLWLIIEEESALSGPLFNWRRTFSQGWLMGLVGFGLHLHWLLAISNEDVNIPGLMIPALLMLGLYLGIFYGLGTLFSRFLRRKCGLPIFVTAPAIFVLLEFLRSIGLLGFPWGAPAYALTPIPELIQVTALGGMWGLCFIILTINALLAAFISGKRICLPISIAIVILLWTTGSRQLPDPRAVDPETESMAVLVAQPDIRREIKWKPERRDEVVDLVFDHAHETLARLGQDDQFDLFVWPETVFPLRLLSDPQTFGRVRALAAEMAKPILIGTQEGYWSGPLSNRQWISHNSAFIFSPNGSYSEPYRKKRLVPFSERMPLQKIAPWLTKIDFGQSDFFPGEDNRLLEAAGAKIGCLICFESAFSEPARDFVRSGADLLVLITNDFWFGSSAGPQQHADICILRAVENRISLVRCANTGVSFLVDPYGRISHRLDLFQQGAILGSVSLGGGSFASRHPDWLINVLVGSLVALSLAGFFYTRQANLRQNK